MRAPTGGPIRHWQMRPLALIEENTEFVAECLELWDQGRDTKDISLLVDAAGIYRRSDRSARPRTAPKNGGIAAMPRKRTTAINGRKDRRGTPYATVRASTRHLMEQLGLNQMESGELFDFAGRTSRRYKRGEGKVPLSALKLLAADGERQADQAAGGARLIGLAVRRSIWPSLPPRDQGGHHIEARALVWLALLDRHSSSFWLGHFRSRCRHSPSAVPRAGRQRVVVISRDRWAALLVSRPARPLEDASALGLYVTPDQRSGGSARDQRQLPPSG